MSDPRPANRELPPIPDGCGILPIAENRIRRGPHPHLSEAEPAGAGPNPALPSDAMEQRYRRVLARALALAAAALLLIAATAASVAGKPPQLPASALSGFGGGLLYSQMLVRGIVVSQALLVGFCSRFVERLGMVPAGVLLFGYAAFTGLEFSALVPPAMLVAAFLCAGLMYGAAAGWGYLCGSDLARPVTPVFMVLGGGILVGLVNLALGSASFTWGVCSLAVVLFAVLAGWNAQQIRDFYQDFDDDNAAGWKASVLGALLLLLSSVSAYLLIVGLAGRSLAAKRENSSESIL